MAGFSAGTSPLACLREVVPDLCPQLERLLAGIATACVRVADTLRTGDAHTKSGVENTFGDEQLHLDVVTNEIVFEELRSVVCWPPDQPTISLNEPLGYNLS
jgi:hypothetical protein